MRKVPSPPDGYTAVDPREWTRAWRRVITAPSVKLIGYLCADWADYKTGANIRPGIPLLMKAGGGMSNKTVCGALEQMRQWGLLWRYHEARLSGIKGDRDIYRLTFPDDISPIPMMPPDWEKESLAACGQPADQVSSRHVAVDGGGTGQVSSRHVVAPTKCPHDTWLWTADLLQGFDPYQ